LDDFALDDPYILGIDRIGPTGPTKSNWIVWVDWKRPSLACLLDHDHLRLDSLEGVDTKKNYSKDHPEKI
jgi:hypothetical protein